jgi:hypothetical protein
MSPGGGSVTFVEASLFIWLIAARKANTAHETETKTFWLTEEWQASGHLKMASGAAGG